MDKKQQSGQDIVERRQFVRIDLQNIAKIEEYKIGGKGERIDTLVKNISAGGILFETNYKYDIGVLLKLEVNIPGWDKYKTEFLKYDKSSASEPLVALAAVVRIEAIDLGSRYEIGACFINIDSDHLKALMHYIEKYQQDLD